VEKALERQGYQEAQLQASGSKRIENAEKRNRKRKERKTEIKQIIIKKAYFFIDIYIYFSHSFSTSPFASVHPAAQSSEFVLSFGAHSSCSAQNASPSSEDTRFHTHLAAACIPPLLSPDQGRQNKHLAPRSISLALLYFLDSSSL
jgi:hypothetical protein